MLTDDIKKYIDQSILCWLATASAENMPNVSPKEIFTWYGDNKILIANIASPQSVKNILVNENICISFIDIFVQKGYQLKGRASIIKRTDPDFSDKYKILSKLISDKFPILSIIEATILKVKPILAPSYRLFPQTTENEQIESAMKIYKVKERGIEDE